MSVPRVAVSEWVSLEAGAVLERRYEIVGLLGRGGFGATYRAVDRSRLGAPCAVKELVPPPARGAPALAAACDRFEREARTLLRLRHAHVPRLHAFFTEDDRYFLVQDLVEGHTLQQLVDAEGPLEEDAVRAVVAQLLDVLEYLHGQTPPVVHRDVKPANVILDPDGRVHLIDFGAVREALHAPADGAAGDGEGPTTRVGTPGYAPFEQVMGRVVPASDLYALGATAVALLTGEQPLAWLGRHGDSWVLDGLTGAGPAFERFLGGLLADPPARFASAGVARAAFDALPALAAPSEAARRHHPTAPRTTTAGPHVMALLAAAGRPRARRLRAAALAGAAGVALVVALVGGRAWRAGRADAALDPNHVTVFPLVTSGDVGGARTVGEDVATMIGAAFDGAGPLRRVDGWALLDARTRDDPRALAPAAARALARERRSGRYVTGRMARRGDSVDVYLELADVAGDSVLATAHAAAAAHDGWRAGLHAATGLLPALVPGAAATTVAAEWSRRPPAAVARFLLGEAAFRRARPAEALGFYRGAVAGDSGFALAAIRGAQAATWVHRQGEAAALVAVARRQPLAPPDAEFARGYAAYMAGDALGAAAAFERATQLDPDMTAAWVQLGETRTHLLPPSGGADSLAAAAFDEARRLDPAGPYVFHVIERRLRLGDTTRAGPLLARFLADAPDPHLAAELQAANACVRRGAAAADWPAAVARDPLAVLDAARSLAGGGAQLGCAAAAYDAVFRGDTTAGPASEDRRWTALVGLQSVLVAQGRTAEAAARIEAAIAAGLGGSSLFLLDAPVAPEFAARADVAAAEDAREFGPDYTRCGCPLRLWQLGVWAAHTGRLAVADVLARQLLTPDAGRETREGADSASVRRMGRSVAAHAALARRDTAEAVRRLSALLAEPVPGVSLLWDVAAPRAADRLVLARLLLARGDPARAFDVAATFDAAWPSVHVLYLPASLRLRADAATALGQPALAAHLRARLATLRAGSPSAPRRPTPPPA